MSKPTTKRHVPQRTCVACGTTDAKRTLTRLVRTPDEGVHVDPGGKRAGRGAYLCSKPECWRKAIKSEVLAKALRTTLTDVDRERLATAMPDYTDSEEAEPM